MSDPSRIADQLYSSKFRLIPELLQNADDAAYSNGVEPCVTFRLRPSELIFESNEVGFQEKNVRAICATGKSSKADDRSTTGEKGFGFKSVFGIANVVHIQSGLWSFKFEHQKGENGVGMVTPIWTEPDPNQLPPEVGARIRLQFSNTSTKFTNQIIAEFEGLSSTIIFALRKLKRLIISLEGIGGRSDKITFQKCGDFDSNHIRISTDVEGCFGNHCSGDAWLRVFKDVVKDLPLEENRKIEVSTVIVAFEVDPEDLPVTSPCGQNVFAFLPVERLSQIPVSWTLNIWRVLLTP